MVVPVIIVKRDPWEKKAWYKGSDYTEFLCILALYSEADYRVSLPRIIPDKARSAGYSKTHK